MRLKAGWFAIVVVCAVDLLTAPAARGGVIYDGPALLVVSGGGNIVRYNANNGQLIDTFATVQTPWGMALGPNGEVYICSSNGDSVFRYDARSAALRW